MRRHRREQFQRGGGADDDASIKSQITTDTMGEAKGEEENIVPPLDSPSHSVGGRSSPTHSAGGDTTTSKKSKGKRHRKKSQVGMVGRAN